jgi:hypothetical protein
MRSPGQVVWTGTAVRDVDEAEIKFEEEPFLDLRIRVVIWLRLRSGFCHIITLACRTIRLPFIFQKTKTGICLPWLTYLGPTPFASDPVHVLSSGSSTSIRLRTYNISTIVLERAAPYISIERKLLAVEHQVLMYWNFYC